MMFLTVSHAHALSCPADRMTHDHGSSMTINNDTATNQYFFDSETRGEAI